MKKVSIESLQENAYVSEPVFLDDKYILLSPEVPISEALKARLREWDISEVFTAGTIIHSLNLEGSETPTVGTQENVQASIKDKERQEAADKFFADILKRICDLFERFKVKGEIKIAEVTEIIKAIMTELKTNKEYLIKVQEVPPDSDYLALHCLRTTILVLALADFLKMPPHKQIDVGMAGLLHRVGMLKMPPQVLSSDKPLSPQERKLILAQPAIGFRILQENKYPLPVCLAVLEHQERMDGSGYPRHITGEKISLYGRIIAVAASYTAAVSKRPFKSGLDGHSGIMDLLKDIGKRYDDRILRSLVFTLSIFPPGTFIALSNGAQGVVVKTNPENPKYPIVKLLLTEEGTPYIEKPILHTSETDVVQITRPLTQQEIMTLKQKVG